MKGGGAGDKVEGALGMHEIRKKDGQAEVKNGESFHWEEGQSSAHPKRHLEKNTASTHD